MVSGLTHWFASTTTRFFRTCRLTRLCFWSGTGPAFGWRFGTRLLAGFTQGFCCHLPVLLQSALTGNLTIRFIFLVPGIGVVITDQLDTDRCTLHGKKLPKTLFQIADIAVGQFVGLLAMYNDQGRIAAPRMGIA